MQKVVGSSPIIRSSELPGKPQFGKVTGRRKAAHFVAGSELSDIAMVGISLSAPQRPIVASPASLNSGSRSWL